MNTTRIDTPRRGLHPLVAAAAIAVIVMCAVGVAAVMGWLPSPSANPHADVPVVSAGPESANLAPAPQASASQASEPPAPAQTGRPASAAAPRPAASAPAPAPAPQACKSCGDRKSVV